MELDPERITTVEQLTRIFSTRYLKVNVEAYMRHGTLEFRQHGATVDPQKVLYWIKFVTRIMEFAKTDNRIEKVGNLYDVLNLSQAERIYWNHRKTVLAA